VTATANYRLWVELQSQSVSTPAGERLEFGVDPVNKHRLLHGLDEIDSTLESASKIREYERQRRDQEPWLFQ
jgi:3-isopropylmalate/(R)-2-methylmalate dehydratase small subunit